MPVVDLNDLEPVDGNPFDRKKGFGTISADNPSWGDRLAGGFSNVMGMLGATPQGQRNAYDVGQKMTGLIPGVSNAVAGNQAYRDFGQGNWGQGILNTAAALPIPGAGILGKAEHEGVPLLKDLLASSAEPIGGKVITDKGVPGILSYHASPHTFNKFDWNKINTGEGTQDEGYGLYSGAHPGTGEFYREQFSDNKLLDSSGNEYKPGILPYGSPESLASYLLRIQGDYDKARESLNTSSDSYKAMGGGESLVAKNNAAIQHLNDLKEAGVTVKKIKAPKYQVVTHDNPDHYLDRDAMFKDMDPHVQGALNKIDKWDPESTGADIHSQIIEKHIQDQYEASEPDYTEASINATNTLRNAGIPGIKYLDDLSKKGEAASKTHNYVSFHAHNMQIMKRYALPAMGAAGAMHVLTNHPDIDKYQLDEQSQ